MNSKKLFAILLAAALILALFAGCGGAAQGSDAAGAASSGSEAASVQAEEAGAVAPAAEAAASAEDAAAEAEASEAEAEPEPEAEPELEYSFPLEESVDLSLWITWHPTLSSICPASEASVFKKMEEITNVHIDYVESSPFNGGQDYDLMLASGDYVDMIPSSDSMTSAQALEQEIAMDLTEYLPTYLYHYNQKLQTNEEYVRAASVGDSVVNIICMYDDSQEVLTGGLVIRKDWLDLLGMDFPETYDDYHEVLTAFKNEIGARSPMLLGPSGILNSNLFCNGFGVSCYAGWTETPYYQVDGEVKFGPVQPEFKDYLTLMNQWYSEGLIYADFYSITDPNTAPKDEVSSNNLGVWNCDLTRMHEFDNMFTDQDSFEIWPAQDPVLNSGDSNHLRPTMMMTEGGSMITTTCEYPEIAMLWQDYLFTDDGIVLTNFGVEGEGFEYNADGEPEFTDLVAKADNLNFALAQYATMNFGFIKNSRMFSTYSDAQMATLDVWTKGDTDYVYPSNAKLTTEESEVFAGPYADINTYLQGEVIKFIIGDRDLSEFDQYVDAIYSMGLDNCIAQKQAAYDRYME